MRAEAGWIDGQPGVEIEPEAAVGIDVGIEQRRDSSEVVDVEAILPGRFGENLLNHERVDVDERELQQMGKRSILLSITHNSVTVSGRFGLKGVTINFVASLLNCLHGVSR